MSGQSHAAVLFLMVMMAIGIAVMARTGERLAHPVRGDAWVCSAGINGPNCLLSALRR